MKLKIHPFAVTVVAAICPLLAFAQEVAPLDTETVNRLAISYSSNFNLQLQPGQTYAFKLGTLQCCYLLKPVQAQVSWSIKPTAGARINPSTGEFTVDRSTPHGSVFEVKADVEEGRRVITAKVYVYTPEANPLVGNWRETSRVMCRTGEAKRPATQIGELEFRADGTFSVTRLPFEMYKDYWGTYAYDLKGGGLKLVAAGGIMCHLTSMVMVASS